MLKFVNLSQLLTPKTCKNALEEADNNNKHNYSRLKIKKERPLSKRLI